MLPLVGPGVPLASFDHCSPASLRSQSRGVRIILEWYLPRAVLRRHRLVAVFGERDGDHAALTLAGLGPRLPSASRQCCLRVRALHLAPPTQNVVVTRCGLRCPHAAAANATS